VPITTSAATIQKAGIFIVFWAMLSGFGMPMALARGEATPSTDAGLAHPQQWPDLPHIVLVDRQTERFIDDLLRKMSLEEKVGQMVQADIDFIKPADLQRYKLGSILAGGNAAPNGDTHAPPRAWRSMVESYQRVAMNGGNPAHAPIPILFGIDAVHGDAKVRGATIFPHNVGLGAAHDPDLLRRIGQATAQEVAATGVDWVFAPTVAVVRDVRWGRSYESYSDDPALVALYADSLVQGLQSPIAAGPPGAGMAVLATAKHFLGDGGTAFGRDQGNTLVPEDVLRDVHAAGYETALAARVAIVMASYNAWQGIKMHANQSLLSGVLKQRWHFDGFVIGDWNAHEEVPGCTKFSCAPAVNAGIDMVMAPDGWREMYANLLQQARTGVVASGRIDDAVRRILRVKAFAGLIGPHAHRVDDPVDDAVIGSAAHRALAREAVQKSLVLLKNDGGLLPLAPGEHILVVGDAADNIGQQCGGWTVDWQGDRNTNQDFPEGTSILTGIRKAVAAGGGTVEFSPGGVFRTRPDAAIVVFGEQPYAEYEGDRENLLLPRDSEVRRTLRKLREEGIPVISVLLSGRVLWTNPELNLSQAFVAAWLPGSEGEGVADMLFRPDGGAARHPFTGRLSFPWPATAMPVGYETGGQVTHALFPRGYGLAGGTGDAATSSTPTVPEDPEIPAAWDMRNHFYGANHPIAPWSVYVGDAVAEVRMTRGEQMSPGGRLETTQGKDGIAAHWFGSGEATWRIGGKAIDLREAAASGQALRITYRVDESPSATVLFGVECGPNCGGWIDVTGKLQSDDKSVWRTLDVKLACLVHGGDLSSISTPLAFKTSGEMTLAISAAELATGSRAIQCDHAKQT
jgi:beta-glucosidase